MYERYTRNMNFETKSNVLAENCVTGINTLNFPHIFDLQDIRHMHVIHNMFMYIANNTPNIISERKKDLKK